MGFVQQGKFVERCKMRVGNGYCLKPAMRQLIWPGGDSVYLCEDHKDDLLITNYMQVEEIGTEAP